MEIENWFKGFEKGLERLSLEQRSAFLSECGKNCVNGGTLSVYQKLDYLTSKTTFNQRRLYIILNICSEFYLPSHF